MLFASSPSCELSTCCPVDPIVVADTSLAFLTTQALPTILASFADPRDQTRFLLHNVRMTISSVTFRASPVNSTRASRLFPLFQCGTVFMGGGTVVFSPNLMEGPSSKNPILDTTLVPRTFLEIQRTQPRVRTGRSGRSSQMVGVTRKVPSRRDSLRVRGFSRSQRCVGVGSSGRGRKISNSSVVP